MELYCGRQHNPWKPALWAWAWAGQGGGGGGGTACQSVLMFRKSKTYELINKCCKCSQSFDSLVEHT